MVPYLFVAVQLCAASDGGRPVGCVEGGRPVECVSRVRVAPESSVFVAVVLDPYGQPLPLECGGDQRSHAPPSPPPAATPPL